MKTLQRELADALHDLLQAEKCVCRESEILAGTCSICLYNKLLKRANALRTFKPPRRIPNTNSIGLFMHCANCLKDKPADIAARDWVKIEAGWTRRGLQLWCRRCEINILHIDFEGAQHPATMAAAKKTKGGKTP